MYPVMLNVKDRVCIVVGGGKAAQIKTASLLKEGAIVRIISSELKADFSNMKITYLAKKYRVSYIKPAFLVIAATDDEVLNRQVVSDAQRLGILALNASDSEGADFIPMAFSRSGDVTAAVSTNGAYPLLAEKIRSEIDVEAYSQMCVILRRARAKILAKDISDEAKDAFLRVLTTDGMIEMGKRDIEAFERQAMNVL